MDDFVKIYTIYDSCVTFSFDYIINIVKEKINNFDIKAEHIKIRPWSRNSTEYIGEVFNIVNIDIYVSKEIIISLNDQLSSIVETYNRIITSHDYVNTCASYNQYNERLEALSKKEKVLIEALGKYKA